MNIGKWLFASGVLHRVRKPARYIGGEYNLRIKKVENKIRIGLMFPDLYEVGMSHTGFQILMHSFNQKENVFSERIFLPWKDMIEEMKNANIPLYTLETYTPIKEMDLIGITLQYELSYTNIIHALKLGNIPIYSKDRSENDPIIIAGGPSASNPEPIADFIDAFYNGDGEAVIDDLIEILSSDITREEKIKRIYETEGFYVPKYYKLKETESGFVVPDYEKRIKIRKIRDLNNTSFPTEQIVPKIRTIHNRAIVEIMRGCNRGCRFCHAGFYYRPVRERTAEKIINLSLETLEKTGYNELSLLSLSTLDYTDLENVLNELEPFLKENRISISLPSSRVDKFGIEIGSKISGARKTGLTFAPEAGSQRLRDVINKNISEEEILNVVEYAKKSGWRRIKLYFMIGLPTETEEDVRAIVELTKKIKKEIKIKDITVNVSIFIPKPHTPFEKERFYQPKEIKEKIKILNEIRKFAKLKIHDPYISLIEALLSRGDRKISELIYKVALEENAIFDEWDEEFDFRKWARKINELGIDTKKYLEKIETDELPWKIIDILLKDDFINNEMKKATDGKTTDDCRWDICTLCGVCIKTGLNNILVKRVEK
ncbi:TIGR03960 family B12-binding radical SAM protein [Marinitoga sp. 1155]|uniref:TIGR03960 family B12-binding radical SAM protein n=1 Tax=Marinitoga sp. 1155 TaxID=1428448 RepID=UPI000640BA42|nr:TIGR03960 family B12-binding radical SAM protein [Marinitoga sp. 1155]KLO23465.1 radical SAM protein [Marinitoga sp. 1155]